MELNREQIIKALECCKFGKDEAKCKECNWHPWIKPRCWRLLASNALSLIKELNEEIESRKQTIDQLGKNNDEIARVYPLAIKEAKADTVRKMQSEIKKTFSAICKGEMVDLYRIIDQIAKEMLEDGHR